MPFARSSALIATAYLALSARALPRPAPTYQVVDAAGPSSSEAAPPAVIYSTIIESSTPTTVTEPAITVTATPSPAVVETKSVTTTRSWTVVISNTEQPASSQSSSLPPLPTLEGPQEATPPTATETTTVYKTVPVAPYAVSTSSSTSCSTSSSTSSSLKGAFTPVSQWNHTVTAIHGPTSAGTGLMYAVVPTGTAPAKQWIAATGTGAYLVGRAAATGSGAYLEGRATPTGYVAEGWNATSYYYGSNDRLA